MVADPGSDEIGYWGRGAFRYFRRAWPKVREVKGPFLGLLSVLVLVFCGATYLITSSILNLDIKNLETQKGTLEATIKKQQSTIADQGAWLAELRSQTQSKSNPAALEQIRKLQRDFKTLRSETDASVSFSPPIVKELKDGAYLVQSVMHINSATPRTGLTIGITTDQFEGFSVVNITGAPLLHVLHGQYTRPDAWTKLGAYRHHFRNVSGAYRIEIKIGKLAPILIGYILEGKEKEGIQRVTWQISEP